MPGTPASGGRRRAAAALVAALLLAPLGPASGQQPEPPVDPPGSATGSPLPGPAGDAGPAGEAAPTAGGDGDEEEPRSTLRLTTDAACAVTVDGESVGTVAPGEVLEHAVAIGSRRIRATSVEYPSAVLDETVEVAEESDREVELRMARTIRITLRDERQEWTYKDLKRNLMWPRRDNGRDVAWRHARRHCDELKHGGFTEWRLPTIEELDQLKAIWSAAPFKITGNIFLSGCCVWSSTRDGEGRAWNYNFRHKRRFAVPTAYSLDLRALCVHALEEWVAPEGGEGAESGESVADGESDAAADAAADGAGG